MNHTPLLTKISRYGFVGSLSAFLSFAGKNNSQLRQFSAYTLGAIIIIFALLCLWEGDSQIETEESSFNLFSGDAKSSKKKRAYLLPPQHRLEISIALVVIVASALIGAL